MAKEYTHEGCSHCGLNGCFREITRLQKVEDAARLLVEEFEVPDIPRVEQSLLALREILGLPAVVANPEKDTH